MRCTLTIINVRYPHWKEVLTFGNHSAKYFQMTTRIFFICLSLALMVYSCSNTKNECAGGLTSIDVIRGYSTPGTIKLSEIVSDVEFVTLEAVPDSYFSGERFDFNRQVSISRNHVLVVVKKYKTLLLFDRKGKFLQKIGRIGNGPGEYVFIETACLDPFDRFIILVDPFSDKIIKYSMEGKVIQVKQFTDFSKQWEPDRIRLLSMDESHLALMLARPKIPADSFSQVLILDNDLNITDSLLKRANDNNLLLRGWVQGHISPSKGKLLFWENYFDTLYYLHADGRQDPRFRLFFSKDDIPAEYFNDPYGQTGWDKLCFIDKIIDLPGYLILFGNYNQDRYFSLAYSKTTKEIARTGGDGRSFDDNDLYAFPLGDFEVNYFENTMYQLIEIYSIDNKSADFLLRKSVLLPNKRDELIRLLKNRTENDNPLLFLMKLRDK